MAHDHAVGNLGAARTGDRRKALEQLRDTLAAAMDAADLNVVAQLSAQYRACLADLAALPVEEGSTVDELARRRADRQSAAQAEPTSGRKAR